MVSTDKCMYMQHRHPAWMCSIDIQPGNAAWGHGHAAWRHGRAVWISSRDMHYVRAACSCSTYIEDGQSKYMELGDMEMHRGDEHGTWTWTYRWWTCEIEIDILHQYGHEASTWTCSIDIHRHAACTWILILTAAPEGGNSFAVYRQFYLISYLSEKI